MEQIKDIVTLRAFALARAVELSSHGDFDSDILDKAYKFECYILDDAKLPESYEDKTMDMYKDFMKELAPKPYSPATWIKVNEAKPPINERVLIRLENTTVAYFGYWRGDKWDIVINECCISDNDGGFTIIAWLPIPEYKENE